MGKRLIQQRRGRGTSTFRAHSFRSKGDVNIPFVEGTATVDDIVSSSHHSAPLMQVRFPNGDTALMIAPEGVKVGQRIEIGKENISTGNTLRLDDMPVGSIICNIEGRPGDGGKFVRGSGTAAKIVGKQKDKVIVLLPSKKRKMFNKDCRATLGTVAGGGRLEKPLLKAGIKFHKMKAKNKYWPKVSGTAMNAVTHPLGGKRTGRKGRPTIAPKNAPPGRKVGMLRPKKTGRARGTRKRSE